MARRFPAAELIALALALVLAACVEVDPRAALPETPERELAMRSQALQRTVQEATVAAATAGASGAYLVGGRGSMPAGLLIGIPVGVTTGTYVGYLQQRYATNEARLERLRADIDITNEETAAAVATMRTVLARQRAALAAARAGVAPGSPELVRQVAAARSSLADMHRAVAGAEGRYDEFGATRALRLVETEATGVDRQIADLGQRIAEMRSIAATLASEI